MLNITLQEIANLCHGELNNMDFSSLHISDISSDTRSLQKNNLYLPLIGENFDGHCFIQQAIDKGAIACLCQRDHELKDTSFPIIYVEDTLSSLYRLASYYRDSLDAKVIAITGSNGKTTTKDILSSLLHTNYRVHKTAANLNNAIGLSQTILKALSNTEILVLEMGMEGFGEIEILTKIAKPDIAMITNIADTHLDELKTKENIARAKFEILQGLKEDGVFLYNQDDPTLSTVIQEYQIPQRVYSFGKKDDNEYILKNISCDEEGNTFSINSQVYTLPLIGEHQQYNGGMAIVVAKILGLNYSDIAKGLLHIELTGMRGEIIHCHNFDILNDCYKSNPQSLNSLLKTIYQLKKYDQVILVLGDMLSLSDREVELHENIGNNLDPNRIHYLITVGLLSKHLSDAAKEKFPNNTVFHFPDKQDATTKIKSLLQPNSLIAFKASRALKLEEIMDAIRNDLIGE